MTTALRPQTKAIVVPFQVKEFDDTARTFTGLAATWDLDLGGDVIEKGAFKRTIGNWKKSKGRKHNLLDSHGHGTIFSVLGDLLEAEENDEGVLGQWGFLAGDRGDAAYTLVKNGNVDSLSIGYETVRVRTPSMEEAKGGIWRFIQELKWLETSLVLFPMNPGATVESVKSLLARGTAITDLERKELEELLPELTALLAMKATPDDSDSPAGLAIDDPARIALEAKVRSITLRELGLGV